MDIAAISDAFLMRLSSFTVQEISSKWKLSRLDRLAEALTDIKQEDFPDSKKAAKMLRDAFYDLDNILDAYEIHSLRSQLQDRRKLLPLLTVRQFFCRMNSFAFRVKMGFEMQDLLKRLHRIQRYGKPSATISTRLGAYDRIQWHGKPIATSSIGLHTYSSSYSLCFDNGGGGGGGGEEEEEVEEGEYGEDEEEKEWDVEEEDCPSRFRLAACRDPWPPRFPRWPVPLTHEFLPYGDVKGRESQKEKVVEVLLERKIEAIVSVLPIVGEDGIGKTTLTKFVYNDERIVNHFQLRIWLNVSQSVSGKKLMENMIKCASGNTSMVSENYAMDELKLMLQRILHNEVYLLVLDDFCSEDGGKWEELKDLLVGGANGSKIVVTTRDESVASLMGTMPMYWIDRLAREDCFSMFVKRVFEQGQEEEHRNLVTIGANIVEKCAGNPLSVNVLAGLLRKEFDENYWTKIRDHSVWNSQQNGNV